MQALPLVPKLQKCTRKLASYIQLMPVGSWDLAAVPGTKEGAHDAELGLGTARHCRGVPPEGCPGHRMGRRERAGAELHRFGSSACKPSALVLFEPCAEPCCSCSRGAAAPRHPLGSTLPGGSSAELAWCSLLPSQDRSLRGSLAAGSAAPPDPPPLSSLLCA